MNMRHVLTRIIAFHWMAVFALLAIVSVLNPEQGILAALTFLGAAPTPDALLVDGGLWAAGFFSFAFAVASILFMWMLATAFFATEPSGGGFDRVARFAFGAGMSAFSLLLFGGATLPVTGLFPVSVLAIVALLASYLCVFAEHRAISMFTAPVDADLQAAIRLMATGAAHSAMLGHITRREPAANLGGTS